MDKDKILLRIPRNEVTDELIIPEIINDWNLVKSRLKFAFPINDKKRKILNKRLDEFGFRNVVDISIFMNGIKHWTIAFLLYSLLPENNLEVMLNSLSPNVETGVIDALWQIDNLIFTPLQQTNTESIRLKGLCDSLETGTYVELFQKIVNF